MKVLIIGSGGREHALAWKARQSPQVELVYAAPGNAGTVREAGILNIDLDISDFPALIYFARDKAVDLTIVGPEAPLVNGIVDCFQEAGLSCFGPSRAAARLEGSKSFSKDFLARHQIPTAAYRHFTEAGAAMDYAKSQSLPMVIKADGLAAGKGVVIARTLAEAQAAITGMLSGERFGSAGQRIVIEEFLRGEEASFIVMVDGKQALPFASSQDHKARDDGDQGPNTGGMGAYSPAPVVTPQVHERIMAEVIRPTVNGMAAEGSPYLGFLYAGLMIMPDGSPKVVEYNCRFGDPEAQPLMLRLQTDLIELCQAALAGRLHELAIHSDPRAAVGVVLAAGGYPGAYAKGHVISGLDADLESSDCKIFHAGATEVDGRVTTSGGRVLCATALGDKVAEAQRKAYRLAAKIHWQDIYYRKDIAHRAIAREAQDDD